MFSMLSAMTKIGEMGSPVGGNNIAEIIKDKLFWMALSGTSPPTTPQTKDAVLFTVDRLLNYEPFFADFGPLNLGQLYRFCQIIESKLRDPELKGKRLIMYTARGPQKKANAGYLISAYQVLILKRSPQDAWKSIAHISQGFLPFRDASMQTCTYKLTILDCLESLDSAVRLNFFNVDTFNVEQYEQHEKIENGDLNIIIPAKFVHFSGPSNTHRDADGYPSKTPADYIDTFKSIGVSDIIRLNKKCYDKTGFTKHGFIHHEMYFIDGTTPSRAILERFISVCEQAKGMVAVHCKAGLGRTGTCVACYMMKHYRIKASEAIAWLRICRPGSVLGPQQQFLEEMQPIMWKEGDMVRKIQSFNSDKKVMSYTIEKQLENVSFSDGYDKQEDPSNNKAQSSSPILVGKDKVEPIESQGDSLIHAKFDAQHRKSDGDLKLDTEFVFGQLPRAHRHQG